MGVKIAGAHGFSLFHPTHLSTAISSISLRRRTRGYAAPCSSPFVSSGIRRMVSFELPPPWTPRRIVRASSVAALDSFSDEEFSKKIQELALQFQLSNDGADFDEENNDSDAVTAEEDPVTSRSDYVESNWPDEVITANLERKVNRMDIPVSLRIIKRKRKMQWDEGLGAAGESAYCSVKAAFSSMVFIIRELHSFTLQMRGALLYENLQGILGRVHGEMHASFVWIFQQIFSHTPTLMVYVMILLANFTVYSVGSNNAMAAAQVGSHSASTELVSVLAVNDSGRKQTGFDSPSSIKSSSSKISSTGGKTISVGGNNGGGGKFRPVATGTGGEGQFPQVDNHRGVLPDGASSQFSSLGTSSKEDGSESVSGRESMEEEVGLWDSIVEESSEMQGSSLDRKTRLEFVSPVTAKIEADDHSDYLGTEICYQKSLWQDPKNPLLLANYAQFLYLVSNDYDRAEEYFKMAVAVDPPDAEAYNKYAGFLWRARGDLWAAEETYLGAISADPTNSFYAANYAHFLWNTGGEDTCFPLNP